MPQVYMFPNPNFGKPTAGGGPPESSALMADPVVAALPGVEAHIRATAKTIGARAAARLNTVKAASSRSEGARGSRIQLDSGVIDSYVILNDERSAHAAWKINSQHGILDKAMPKGKASLTRKRSDYARSEYPDVKPPKGLVIELGPS